MSITRPVGTDIGFSLSFLLIPAMLSMTLACSESQPPWAYDDISDSRADDARHGDEPQPDVADSDALDIYTDECGGDFDEGDTTGDQDGLPPPPDYGKLPDDFTGNVRLCGTDDSSGIRVTFTDTRGSLSGTTDNNGDYVISGLQEGTYDITFESPFGSGYEESATLKSFHYYPGMPELPPQFMSRGMVLRDPDENVDTNVSHSYNVRFTPDSRFLIVQLDSNIKSYEIATGVWRSLADDMATSRFLVSPDSSYVAYVRRSYVDVWEALILVAPDASWKREFSASGKNCGINLISPDGKLLTVTRNGESFLTTPDDQYRIPIPFDPGELSLSPPVGIFHDVGLVDEPDNFRAFSLTDGSVVIDRNDSINWVFSGDGRWLYRTGLSETGNQIFRYDTSSWEWQLLSKDIAWNAFAIPEDYGRMFVIGGSEASSGYLSWFGIVEDDGGISHKAITPLIPYQIALTDDGSTIFGAFQVGDSVDKRFVFASYELESDTLKRILDPLPGRWGWRQDEHSNQLFTSLYDSGQQALVLFPGLSKAVINTSGMVGARDVSKYSVLSLKTGILSPLVETGGDSGCENPPSISSDFRRAWIADRSGEWMIAVNSAGQVESIDLVNGTTRQLQSVGYQTGIRTASTDGSVLAISGFDKSLCDSRENSFLSVIRPLNESVDLFAVVRTLDLTHPQMQVSPDGKYLMYIGRFGNGRIGEDLPATDNRIYLAPID